MLYFMITAMVGFYAICLGLVGWNWLVASGTLTADDLGPFLVVLPLSQDFAQELESQGLSTVNFDLIDIRSLLIFATMGIPALSIGLGFIALIVRKADAENYRRNMVVGPVFRFDTPLKVPLFDRLTKTERTYCVDLELVVSDMTVYREIEENLHTTKSIFEGEIGFLGSEAVVQIHRTDLEEQLLQAARLEFGAGVQKVRALKAWFEEREQPLRAPEAREEPVVARRDLEALEDEDDLEIRQSPARQLAARQTPPQRVRQRRRPAA